MYNILVIIGSVGLILGTMYWVSCKNAWPLFDNEPHEINKAEERLRANKQAAIDAEEKLGGYKK